MSTAAGAAGGRPSWSLRQRLRLVLAVLAVLVTAVVTVAAVLLAQVRSQQHRTIDRYFAAITLSDQLYADLLAADSGVRGYLLTGRQSELAPLRALTSRDVAAKSAELRRLIGGNADVEAALRRAGTAAGAWRTSWNQALAARASGSPNVVASDVAKGARLFDRLRSSYSAYQAKLVATRNATADSLRFRTTVLLALVIAGGAAMLLAGVAVWVALRRWVLDPLARIAAQTRIVRRGELEHAVEFAGPAELAGVSSDVESMRRRLVAEIEEGDEQRLRAEQAREDLAAQAAELQRSNRDLEQFAYVASHDLQEPLRKVASFCQLLERRYKGQLDERADQYIAFAVDGAKRMQRLINDLLAFSRVGRLSADFADVTMEDCLAQALRNLDASIEATGAEVTWDPLPVVRGESGLLVQLLQNLVGNAMKFRGEAPPQIHIGVQGADDMWEFCCADNGIGVEPRYAERIFVIFQRLHPKDEYEGTGIGLAMCKKIVEYHGGHIWLDTSVASGTTFRWTLPIADEETDDESDEAAEGAADTRNDESATDAPSSDRSSDTVPVGAES